MINLFLTLNISLILVLPIVLSVVFYKIYWGYKTNLKIYKGIFALTVILYCGAILNLKFLGTPLKSLESYSLENGLGTLLIFFSFWELFSAVGADVSRELWDFKGRVPYIHRLNVNYLWNIFLALIFSLVNILTLCIIYLLGVILFKCTSGYTLVFCPIGIWGGIVLYLNAFFARFMTLAAGGYSLFDGGCSEIYMSQEPIILGRNIFILTY